MAFFPCVGQQVEDQVTKTGNPLSFTTDSEQVAQNTVITFMPIQAGSGDPSQSNVRAISGYNNISLMASKANLCTHPMNGGYAYATGIFNPSSVGSFTSAKAKVEPQKTYTASFGRVGGNRGYIAFDSNWNRLASNEDSQSLPSFTFETPANCAYVIVQTSVSINNIGYIQVEEGETATTPDIATDISIKLNETIYGGTLDVESGKLVVDRGYKKISSTSQEYSHNTTGAGLYNLIADVGVKPYDDSIISNRLSLDMENSYWLENESAINNSNGGAVQFAIKDITTASDMNSFLANNPVEIVYPLATPITIQLPPAQVKLLQGANVVTINGTSMILTYRNGEVAKLSDLSGLADSVNAISPVVQKAEDITAVISANGAKNLLPYPYVDTTKAESGLTFTDNGDGTIAVSGTSTVSAYTFQLNTSLHLPKGTYKLTGCPVGGGLGTSYVLWVHTLDETIWAADIGNGTSFDVNDESQVIYVTIVVYQGYIISTPITFKPMITIADQPNSDYAHYVPYSMTNRELTYKIAFFESKYTVPSLPSNVTALFDGNRNLYSGIGAGIVTLGYGFRCANVSAGYSNRIDLVLDIPSNLLPREIMQARMNNVDIYFFADNNNAILEFIFDNASSTEDIQGAFTYVFKR